MPMFWSKKSKAEKNYGQAARPVKGASAGAVGGKSAAAGSTKKGKASAGAARTAPTKAVAIPVAAPGSISSAAGVVIRPHVTEKSGILAQSGVYTFQISEDATKSSISKAMAALYKVTPVRVALINLPDKKVFVRGKRGTSNAVKKAMVYLKKGEKIEIA